MNEFRNGDLVFDVRDEGPETGEVVILLHGFPQTKEAWDDVVPGLVAADYRVLAPDQRGYSRRARPSGRRSYTGENLVGDVLALADAARAERFHVVGHDWGGAVAWYLAMWHPDRLRSATVLATPHPAAFRRALLTSTQIFRSWYFLVFQLPRLPEWMTTSAVGGPRFRKALVRSGLPERKVDAYLSVLSEPGAATSIVNWYRAAALTAPSQLAELVTVPTLYVYGTHDVALGRRGAELTKRFVTGPYRYEPLDASHWMPEEIPEVVTKLIVEHIGS